MDKIANFDDVMGFMHDTMNKTNSIEKGLEFVVSQMTEENKKNKELIWMLTALEVTAVDLRKVIDAYYIYQRQQKMEYIIVKQESPEGEFMWDWLAKHPLNEGLEKPMEAMNEGEAWQYMGSYKHENKVIHEFRHRNHPKINGKTVISVSASEAFNVESIEAKEL